MSDRWCKLGDLSRQWFERMGSGAGGRIERRKRRSELDVKIDYCYLHDCWRDD